MLSKDISSIRVKMLFLPLRLRCSCALHRWNQVLCFLRDYAPRSPSTLGTLHAVLPFLARMLLCTCRQKTLETKNFVTRISFKLSSYDLLVLLLLLPSNFIFLKKLLHVCKQNPIRTKSLSRSRVQFSQTSS